MNPGPAGSLGRVEPAVFAFAASTRDPRLFCSPADSLCSCTVSCLPMGISQRPERPFRCLIYRAKLSNVETCGARHIPPVVLHVLSREAQNVPGSRYSSLCRAQRHMRKITLDEIPALQSTTGERIMMPLSRHCLKGDSPSSRRHGRKEWLFTVSHLKGQEVQQTDGETADPEGPALERRTRPRSPEGMTLSGHGTRYSQEDHPATSPGAEQETPSVSLMPDAAVHGALPPGTASPNRPRRAPASKGRPFERAGGEREAARRARLPGRLPPAIQTRRRKAARRAAATAG